MSAVKTTILNTSKRMRIKNRMVIPPKDDTTKDDTTKDDNTKDDASKDNNAKDDTSKDDNKKTMYRLPQLSVHS